MWSVLVVAALPLLETVLEKIDVIDDPPFEEPVEGLRNFTSVVCLHSLDREGQLEAHAIDDADCGLLVLPCWRPGAVPAPSCSNVCDHPRRRIRSPLPVSGAP